MHYIIDEATFLVEIFASETEEVPFVRQPTWPNGTVFASYDEAEQWAKELIESLEDVNAHYPSIGPGLPRQPKVISEPIEEANPTDIGVDAENSSTPPDVVE